MAAKMQDADKPKAKSFWVVPAVLAPVDNLPACCQHPRMYQKQDRWTPAQAWEKMKGWCAWQERCQHDVMDKLRGAGLTAAEADTIIARLIEENYLNEERFAIQFAGGHFRMKKWGKTKIAYALRQKKISEYCIKRALADIPDEDHEAVLHKLARAKWAAVKAGTPAQRWAKTKTYLLQKGFGSSEVNRVMQWLQRGAPDGGDGE